MPGTREPEAREYFDRSCRSDLTVCLCDLNFVSNVIDIFTTPESIDISHSVRENLDDCEVLGSSSNAVLDRASLPGEKMQKEAPRTPKARRFNR